MSQERQIHSHCFFNFRTIWMSFVSGLFEIAWTLCIFAILMMDEQPSLGFKPCLVSFMHWNEIVAGYLDRARSLSEMIASYSENRSISKVIFKLSVSDHYGYNLRCSTGTRYESYLIMLQLFSKST